MDKLNYKIIKKSKNDYDTLIKVSGGTREITLREMLLEKKQCEKVIQELESNIKIKEVVKSNVSGTNPIVLTLEEKDLVACYLYQEANSFCKEATKALENIKKQLERLDQDFLDVLEQTGLKLEENGEPR